MTREEAILNIEKIKEFLTSPKICWSKYDNKIVALNMAIEALSVANLKEEFESAVPNCKKCAIKQLWEETEKEDLVSVVRCKDCRYAMVRTEEEMNKPIKPQPILCEWFCIGVDNDDYCSHGERRK